MLRKEPGGKEKVNSRPTNARVEFAFAVSLLRTAWRADAVAPRRMRYFGRD
jgi:hypothetical protein